MVLVALEMNRRDHPWSLEETLAELEYLANTAGAVVVGIVTQRANRLGPTYVGSGKVEEIREMVVDLEADTVIFDDELTPSQQRNLERELGCKVIDRTALILDVFGQHASTYEGKLQVELAQHEYLLPRLAGQWSHLERLGGGIGTGMVIDADIGSGLGQAGGNDAADAARSPGDQCYLASQFDARHGSDLPARAAGGGGFAA